MISGALPGPDGLARCPWALSAPEYLAYHDDEWGRPVSTVQGLYERMTLEAFQSGLSWITILRKRENFRRAFAGFWPERVAAFTDHRHRATAERSGHRSQPGEDCGGHRERSAGCRSWREVCRDRSQLSGDRPAASGCGGAACHSPESIGMARELKGLGFRFVGPTTAYATMQAIGLVDDHVVGCFAPPPVWPEVNPTPGTRPTPEPDSGRD